MNELFCLIKFAEKEFADKLLKKGEVYFSLPSHYKKLKEQERGDNNEGAEWIDNALLTNLKVNHPTLGTFEFKPLSNVPSRIVQYNNYYLSFSLYAVTPSLFIKDNTHKIASNMRGFGDTAIIINEPFVFLEAIIAELNAKKLRYEMNTIVYKDLTNGKVKLTPFIKKQEHQHQHEFIIIIENIDNIPKLITIGSIEKYSKLVSTETIIESIWTGHRTSIDTI
jgi:hypothetical protein